MGRGHILRPFLMFSPQPAERTPDLLWVLPLLTCGHLSFEEAFLQVREF